MTKQKLASALAKMEGRKSQVKIGDIREILSLLIILEAAYRIKEDVPTEPSEVLAMLDEAATELAFKQIEKNKKIAAKAKTVKKK